MPDKPRYFIIRDQLDRWRGLMGRLREGKRYWLADRLRNAIQSAGVQIVGDRLLDADAYAEAHNWARICNETITTGSAQSNANWKQMRAQGEDPGPHPGRPSLVAMPDREDFYLA